MDTNTTIVLSYITDSEEHLQKSITYANPAASDEVLAGFATKLNDLTRNTLESVTRLNKIKIA